MKGAIRFFITSGLLLAGGLMLFEKLHEDYSVLKVNERGIK